MMRLFNLPALLLSILSVCSCAGGPLAGQDRHGDAPAGGGPGAKAGERPVAVLRNSTITWNDLYPSLSEAAGAVALEEVVLDRMLDSRVAAAAITIAGADVTMERDRLITSIAAEAGISTDQAQSQVDRLCRARGLGPKRFNALLIRNARLRALARADVKITPDQVAAEERITNGERARVRVFMHPSQAVCVATRERVTAGGADAEVVAARFADAAIKESVDTSSVRGGLMESVSAGDPAVPEAIRTAISTLTPGAVSPVLVTSQGFALVLLESRTTPPALIPLEEVETRLRARLERVAMERYAQQLLRESQLTVLDDSLGWSWEASGRR